jgi:hypothetical protein
MMIKIPIALLFLVLFSGCGFSPDCGKFLDEKIRPGRVNGLVIKKERSKEHCFGEIVVQAGVRSDTLKYLSYCNTIKEKEVWSNISEGDSIFKADGEITVTIVRGGVRKVMEIRCLDLR